MRNLSLVEEIIAPSPATEKGRPIGLDCNPKFWAIYPHGRCVYFLPRLAHEAVREIRHSHEITAVRLYRNDIQPVNNINNSDGMILMAVGDIRGTIKIFLGDQVVLEEPMLAGRISDIRWSENGKMVMAVGEGRGQYCTALILEANMTKGQNITEIIGNCSFTEGNVKRIGELCGPTKTCTSVSEAGGWWAVASDDFTVSLFHSSSPTSPLRLGATLRDHSRFVTSVAFSPSGRRLLTGGADGRVFCYEKKIKGPSGTGNDINETEKEEWHNQSNGNSQVLPLKQHDNTQSMVMALSWLDEETAIVALANGSLQIWNISQQTLLRKIQYKSQILGMRCIRVMNDSYITIGLLGGSLQCLRAADLIAAFDFAGHLKSITCLHLNLEKTGLYHSGDVSGWICKHHTEKTIECKHLDNVNSISFICDSWLGIISEDYGHHQVLYNVTDPFVLSQRKIIINDGSGVLAVRHLKTPSTLTVVTKKAIWVYKGDSEECLNSPPTSLSIEATSADISEDGQFVYYSTTDGSIRRAHLDKDYFIPEEQWVARGNIGKITIMAVGEKFLAAGDDQRRIQLYDLKEAILVNTKWCHHTCTVTNLAWSNDGELLASAGLDNALLIWSPNWSKIKPLAEVRNAHASPITAMQFGREDGDILLTGGADGVIRKWHLMADK